MKKIIFATLFLMSILCIQAQNIEFTNINESYTSPSKEKVKYFDYIDPQMDLSAQTKIADCKLTIDKKGKYPLDKTFFDLWKEANKKSANSFSIESIAFENNQYLVDVSLYHLSDSDIDTNLSLYDDNLIIIFGDLNTNNDNKKKSCKVNKEKIEILPYTYAAFQNEIGEKTKISVGGLMGSSITIKGEDGKIGSFFSLGGFSAAPAVGIGYGYGGAGGGVGISISTGNIYPMEPSFGLFVMTILDTVKGSEQ